MKKILIYNSGGGLGDSLQLISLILTLQNHFKKTKFFYLGAHTNHFQGKLKEFNINIDTLNLNLKYFGFRWRHLLLTKRNFKKKKINKFELIIDLQSKFRNSLILKRIPHDHFYSNTLNNLFLSKKIKFQTKDHIKNLGIFFGEKIKTVSFDWNKLPKDLINEARRLLPKTNYIGFSITQGTE